MLARHRRTDGECVPFCCTLGRWPSGNDDHAEQNQHGRRHTESILETHYVFNRFLSARSAHHNANIDSPISCDTETTAAWQFENRHAAENVSLHPRTNEALLGSVACRNQLFTRRFDSRRLEIQLLLVAHFLHSNSDGVMTLENSLQQVFRERIFDIGFDGTA